MIALYKFLRILLVCAALFLVLPRPVAAQDGCGALGWLFGCDYELQATRAANENSQAMAQISAQATATALNAQQQAEQLRYQQWLASEQAQQELARIASRERVDSDRIRAELEQMYARERMASMAATTAFNVAALQSDAMVAVAASRTEAAQTNQVIALLVVVAVLAAAGSLAYVAAQYRRTVEVQAAPRLLPRDEWQRQAVALLEARGVPWQLRDQRLLAQIDGVWKVVE